LIETTLASGTYTLVLSQSDNSPLGPTLGDGFFRTGQGNFTGPLFLGVPGSFIDANPNQRTNAWAVDLLNVDSASDGSATSAVPEPASLTLLGLGLAGMAGRRWRQRKAS
jgi:hypothetical protein